MGRYQPCKTTSIAFQATSTPRPSSACASRRPTLIDTEQGSRQSTSAAITIPSPPLTPYVGFDDNDIDSLDLNGDEKLDNDIFSSRYRKGRRKSKSKIVSSGGSQKERQDSISSRRRSTSAPMILSPAQKRAQSCGPSPGFTFTNNASTPQSDESYACFVNKMEKDYWKSVSTIRSTYFFDGIGRGGGFLAIPHLASHGNGKTNVICRLLEDWLTKKLVEPTISDSIPVLEDSIQSCVLSIESHLKADLKVWAGISQAYIHIRCGHVFMLDTCCDDQTIVHLGADEFYQEYPLFVDVEIKMHKDSVPSNDEQQQQQPPCKLRGPSTEVLIVFQNVVHQNSKVPGSQCPYIHRTTISESSH
ncbi:hypothetical protein BG011_007473 [Mortierella polycephala]|uniref:Uncharacterized protein n=1 Tax=Mortierella polycephala TaxID=41804 RepID=A0A9P6U8H6_9FUNG|nr:hypothetical protein BG011_007473 [Mortierella polycephala]